MSPPPHTTQSRGAALYRLLPFSPTTTPLQATTYLLGISLFSISFLVFLNATVSFVITDRLGIKTGVGDIVGTLGFVDEIVALIACPAWGLLSDRLGVRWVAVLGYAVIGVALACFVQARDVGGLVVVRILFAVGATAATTMVTAVLPVLTDGDRDGDVMGRERHHSDDDGAHPQEGEDCGVEEEDTRVGRTTTSNPRHSMMSTASDVTITQERFARSLSAVREQDDEDGPEGEKGKKPSALAGYVGLFTGCGALVALTLFLPLPAQFGEKEGVTPAEAVKYSYYVVAVVAFVVAVFVFFGFRGLRGEEQKGWKMLLGLRNDHVDHNDNDEAHGFFDGSNSLTSGGRQHNAGGNGLLPYRALLLSSLRLGFTDPHIALGYLGGFVARASTVAISLFIPLYINTYFMKHGFCQGSPHDPSPELKKECHAAYVLTAILTGVAQLIALICAPVFGYLSSRRTGFSLGSGRGRWRLKLNVPVLVGALCGIAGYIIFPRLESPEFKDNEGRGGSARVFLVMALLGISQIAAIVCSLGSLGRGVLSADLPGDVPRHTVAGTTTSSSNGGRHHADPETQALLENGNGLEEGEKFVVSRVQLKGSIAGVYSWCGGAAILLLTKLGGYLFDVSSNGAPFYMMAGFNAILFVVSLGVDVGRSVRDTRRRS